jgi:hypothetical protein
MSLGNKKHDCVEGKKDADNKKRQAEGKKPLHGGEKGYQVDDSGKLVRDGGKPKVDDIAGRRAQRTANVSRARSATHAANEALGTARTKLTDFLHARTQASGRGRARGGGTGGIRTMFFEAAAASLAESIVVPQMQERFEKAVAAATEQASSAATDLAKAEAESITRRQGFKYPDGSVLDPDGKIAEMSEYKFPCPKEEGYSDILKDLKTGGEATPNAELKLYSTKGC